MRFDATWGGKFGEVACALWRDETGQDLIEYGLVAALIAVGAIASIKPIAGKLNTLFSAIATALSSAI